MRKRFLKGKKGSIIIWVIIIIILIALLVISYSIIETYSTEETESICDQHISELSCEKIQKCYDECDEEPIIFWAMNCRDKIKPYLWECIFEK